MFIVVGVTWTVKLVKLAWDNVGVTALRCVWHGKSIGENRSWLGRNSGLGEGNEQNLDTDLHQGQEAAADDLRSGGRGDHLPAPGRGGAPSGGHQHGHNHS